jgi:hypothetical protein
MQYVSSFSLLLSSSPLFYLNHAVVHIGGYYKYRLLLSSFLLSYLNHAVVTDKNHVHICIPRVQN